MELSIWKMLVDAALPRPVRDLLTIADHAGSNDLSKRARRRAACGLMEAYGLTAAEAAELMAVEAEQLRCA